MFGLTGRIGADHHRLAIAPDYGVLTKASLTFERLGNRLLQGLQHGLIFLSQE